MTDAILQPFQFPFMQNAFLIALILTGMFVAAFLRRTWQARTA